MSILAGNFSYSLVTVAMRKEVVMMKKITGLCDDEVIKSREKYGSNMFCKEKRKGLTVMPAMNLHKPIRGALYDVQKRTANA